MSLSIQLIYAAVLGFVIFVSASCIAAAESKSLPDWWNPTEATAGVQLTVQRRSPEKALRAPGGNKMILVKLDAAGFPRDKQYELWKGRLDGNAEKMVDLMVDRSGEMRLINPKTGKLWVPLKDLKVQLAAFAKGEPFYLALVSTDKKIRAFANIIPFPLESRDGTCRVWLEFISMSGEMFVAQGEGFEPGEEVKTVSRSNGEVLRNKLVVTSEGLLPGILLAPAAKGGRHKANFSVMGRACVLTIDYTWGADALRKKE